MSFDRNMMGKVNAFEIMHIINNCSTYRIALSEEAAIEAGYVEDPSLCSPGRYKVLFKKDNKDSACICVINVTPDEMKKLEEESKQKLTELKARENQKFWSNISNMWWSAMSFVATGDPVVKQEAAKKKI